MKTKKKENETARSPLTAFLFLVCGSTECQSIVDWPLRVGTWTHTLSSFFLSFLFVRTPAPTSGQSRRKNKKNLNKEQPDGPGPALRANIIVIHPPHYKFLLFISLLWMRWMIMTMKL
jgi:hypothetical protein